MPARGNVTIPDGVSLVPERLKSIHQMRPLLTDSHCHLDRLSADLDEVLAEANEAGVGCFLCVSINMENVERVIAIAREYPSVYASVGVHPNEKEGPEPAAEELSALAEAPRVVAIGETGLDYFHGKGELEWQRERFRRHIAVAKACGKPLIVHMRDSARDTLSILKEEGAAEVGGVMHCFTGDWQTAAEAMEMGFYISFSGIVTFKNADALREVAVRVPEQRLLIETDSPYLAPVPYRGKPNRPAYVRLVAERLAELRHIPLEQLAEQTTKNFHQLFQTNRVAVVP